MAGIAGLPERLQQRLRAELKPGETLTWVGQPNPNRSMVAGFVLWIFFVPWTAFAVFWMAASTSFAWPTFGKGWDVFSLIGLPFLLIGIAGLYSPWWMRKRAKSTIYAITNERALSIEGGKSITVKSFMAADLGTFEKNLFRDGSGNLILRSQRYRDNDGDLATKREGFYFIADVEDVERLIDQLAEGRARSPATTF